MDPFQLSEDVILDIDAVWLYLLEKDSVAAADRIVEELFDAFHKLAAIPSMGHRRVDLTSRNVLFYRVYSYLVIYEPPSKPLQNSWSPAREAQRCPHSEATANRLNSIR